MHNAYIVTGTLTNEHTMTLDEATPCLNKGAVGGKAAWGSPTPSLSRDSDGNP